MGILIIFFFLVIFGFSFYTNVQSWTFEQQKRINLELNIIKMYQRAKFMSEFQCSFKDISVDNCYDMYKLLAFEQIIEKEKGVKDYYINMFGQSQINIVELYPGDSQYFIYNNSIGDYTFKEVVGIPVSIYNATSKKFALGLLNITVYSK